MEQTDVPEVSRVERRCFENPWPASAYRRELRNPRQNYYVVLRAGGGAGGPLAVPARHGEGFLSRLPLLHLQRKSAPVPEGPHIAGFAGMWSVYDEAHITTIGVDPAYRGRGFGELLLLAMFDEAVRRAATWLTLEVRVSNDVAQRLYDKYGMSIQGIRKRYYSDNGEDAYVMWSRSLKDEEYLKELDHLRTALRERLGHAVDVPCAPQNPWEMDELRRTQDS